MGGWGKGGGESKAEGECLAEGGFQLHRLAIRGVSGFVGLAGWSLEEASSWWKSSVLGATTPGYPQGALIFGANRSGDGKKKKPKTAPGAQC